MKNTVFIFTNVRRWCTIFDCGWTSLVYEIRFMRPLSFSSCLIVDEMDNVIREKHRTMLNEIKEQCNIFYGSAWDIVYVKQGYMKVCSRWVPKQHTGYKMACIQCAVLNIRRGTIGKEMCIWLGIDTGYVPFNLQYTTTTICVHDVQIFIFF